MASKDSESDAQGDRPYQVVIYVGPATPVLDGVKVTDLTVSDGIIPAPAPVVEGEEHTVLSHPVIDRLRASGLTPADLRSRVLFLVEATTDPAAAVAAYAAMVGFAGRRVDAACGSSRIDAASLDARSRTMSASVAVDPSIEHVQVGATHPELASVGLSGSLSPDEIVAVRSARRVRLVPAADALGAIAQFVVVSALRTRGEADRFPFLVAGDEPVPADGEETMTVGLDLDGVRRAAVELRRSLRSEDRSSLAPKVDLTARQRTLLAAAAMPLEATMSALGATSPDGELWHCPRPERHTNGDANPSMRIHKGKARCFRCDPERVDSLRLVMDVKGSSADEAAAWLLANVTPPPVETIQTSDAAA